MNYLALVNRVRSECGISAAALATLQSGLTASSQRFVDWVGQAWQDVQTARDNWQWMRKTVSFSSVSTQAAYTLAECGATDLQEWIRDSFREYLTSTGISGEQFMSDVPYDVFRDTYQFGPMRSTTGMPLWITVQPDHTLRMWPVPDAVYTVAGEYYRAPTSLSADADSPSDAGNDLPERFHMLIVYKAMLSYATFAAAPEVEARARREAGVLMAKLDLWGLPQMMMPGPLA